MPKHPAIRNRRILKVNQYPGFDKTIQPGAAVLQFWRSQSGLARWSEGGDECRTLSPPEFKLPVSERQLRAKLETMGMKLYVGNLSYDTSEDRLRELFSEHGDVASASLVMDRDTGRPRGFGFVEFNDDAQAKAAMEALNGKSIDGRDLTVNEARPRTGGGGGRGGYGGGGGGGGGRRGGW